MFHHLHHNTQLTPPNFCSPTFHLLCFLSSFFCRLPSSIFPPLKSGQECTVSSLRRPDSRYPDHHNTASTAFWVPASAIGKQPHHRSSSSGIKIPPHNNSWPVSLHFTTSPKMFASQHYMEPALDVGRKRPCDDLDVPGEQTSLSFAEHRNVSTPCFHQNSIAPPSTS